jgi:excisionase family DNA binding protein
MSFMSISTLAEYLDVSKNTALRLVERGILPAPVQIGSLKRWEEDAVKKSIAATLDAAASGRAALPTDPDDAARRFADNAQNRKKAPRRRHD